MPKSFLGLSEVTSKQTWAGRFGLLTLSYRRMERLAGFEPATTRLSDEVTAIFTTDRGKTVGGEQAMLLLPLRATAFRRAGLEPARRRSALPRSNRHLHHRLADTHCCASAIERARWGTGDIGVQ